MKKDIFADINSLSLSDMQIKSAQNILNSKNLYYAVNDNSSKMLALKSGLVKIGTMDLKDKKTFIDMFIEKTSTRRVILIRENDKEFFIVSSLWQEVL